MSFTSRIRRTAILSGIFLVLAVVFALLVRSNVRAAADGAVVAFDLLFNVSAALFFVTFFFGIILRSAHR